MNFFSFWCFRNWSILSKLLNLYVQNFFSGIYGQGMGQTLSSTIQKCRSHILCRTWIQYLTITPTLVSCQYRPGKATGRAQVKASVTHMETWVELLTLGAKPDPSLSQNSGVKQWMRIHSLYLALSYTHTHIYII